MLGLFLIGMPLTIIGFYIAYSVGSKKEETKEWRGNDME